MTKGAERTEKLVDVLRVWQGIERASIEQCAKTIEETSNPFIRIVMGIIRNDSLMHHRVQQFLIDSVTTRNVNVSREELAAVWKEIEAHDAIEKRTIELAEELLKEAYTPIHKQLLTYLITDEKKHDSLLAAMNEIKVDLAKSSGS